MFPFLDILAMSDEYTKIMVQTETTKEDVKTSYDWKVIVGSVSGIVILLVILNRIPKYVVVIKRKMSKKKKITPFDKDLERQLIFKKLLIDRQTAYKKNF